MAKTRQEYNEKFKTIRVRVEDYNSLLLVHEKTQIPIVGLFHLAIPMLMKKYRIKEEQRVVDIIEGQIRLKCGNVDGEL